MRAYIGPIITAVGLVLLIIGGFVRSAETSAEQARQNQLAQKRQDLVWACNMAAGTWAPGTMPKGWTDQCIVKGLVEAGVLPK